MGWRDEWCPEPGVMFPLQAPLPLMASVKQGVSKGWSRGQQARFVLRFVLRGLVEVDGHRELLLQRLDAAPLPWDCPRRWEGASWYPPTGEFARSRIVISCRKSPASFWVRRPGRFGSFAVPNGERVPLFFRR